MSSATQEDAAEVTHEGRRADIERWLSERYATWEFYPEFPVSEIDATVSRQNQARLDQPILPDLLEKYADAMKNDAVFPPLVAYRDPHHRGALVIIDGNHRHAAMIQTGRETTPLYLVKAAPETIMILTYEANARNGQPPTSKETIKHAIHLMDTTTMTIESVARLVGIRQSTFQAAWLTEQADRRARLLKVRAWDKLGAMAKRSLRVVHTDAGFVALSRLAIDGNLTAEEVSQAVKEVNNFRSDEEQENAVKVIRDRLLEAIQERGAGAGTKTRKGRKNPRTLIRAHLAYVNGADAFSIRQSCATDAQREEIAQACVATAERLLQLAEEVRG